MAIQAGDIKLIASSVMLDVPEGGGAPSGNVINDATTNTIFPDISELDRAGGRVNLRKVFAKVQTPDTDGFYGVNVIVAEPFEDPRVSATLFTTGDVFDRRDSASSRMEAYLARGASYSGFLFGDHIAGQSVVTLFQREETPLPTIGQTLVLTKNLGLVNEFSQYVRITSVEGTLRTFEDTQGEFKRVQVVCEISDQLQEDFPGFEPFRFDSSVSYVGKTKVSETVIADAARYYGCVPLESAVAIGDYSAQAEGIFTQLVPSTRVEVPIADSRMNQQVSPNLKAGEAITMNVVLVFTAGVSMFIGAQITPGTLSIVRDGTTLLDKAGALLNGSTSVGTVDYDNGVIRLSTSVFGAGSGNHAVTFTPAVKSVLANESFGYPVTETSQRLTWVLSLVPIPSKGTLQVSYRALGQWYVLSDDGSGALRGSDSSVGAGTINYLTGTASVTLGALPDVDTHIIYAWSSPAPAKPVPAPGTTPGANDQPDTSQVGQSGTEQRGKATFIVPFGASGLKPGSLTMSWNDGTARTATDNSTNGLAGFASGRVDYSTGTIYFQPNSLPAKGTVLSVTCDELTNYNGVRDAFTDGGSTWTLALGGSFSASTLRLYARAELLMTTSSLTEQLYQTDIYIWDDGSGNLMCRLAALDPAPAAFVVGGVNYTTGLITINKSISGVTYYDNDFAIEERYVGGATIVYKGKKTRTGTVSIRQEGFSTPGSLLYTTSGAGSSITKTFPLNELTVYATTSNSVTPTVYGAADHRGYNFTGWTIGTYRYTVVSPNSYSDGIVKLNVDPATGAGTSVGTTNRLYGRATITEWPSNANPIIGDLRATQVVTEIAPQPNPASPPTVSVSASGFTDYAIFRTAVSPLVNSGFQIAGNWLSDGAAFSATANSSGIISTGSAPSGELIGDSAGTRGIFGKVNYETGVVELRFGRRVPSAWYGHVDHPGVIDISSVGVPSVQYVELQSVISDTLRYNASGYSYLPLDPDILGLDPVRLPADGRVPIFRQGTFAVLGHTGVVGPATVTNGQTLNAGRVRLSRARIIDANGQVINTGYTADLDAGTVTFTDVSTYDQPITFEHRVEDTVLVSSAQINGLISFTRPSTHVYPVPGSYISSALVAGDVQARVTPAFDQQTWTGVWQDSPIGSPATGSFNDTLHPITTTNQGALTERWAAIFTNSTSFQVVGEHVGVIAVGNTGSTCSPLNPATGTPYFSIPPEGWGLGWATGNVMRFNTVGAEVPVWVARTILQGPETVEEDDFTILIRGDVNRP